MIRLPLTHVNTAIMAEHGLNESDFPEIGNQALMLDLLNGKQELNVRMNKRPRRKQRGIVTLFLTFHTPQGAGNLPVILLKF